MAPKVAHIASPDASRALFGEILTVRTLWLCGGATSARLALIAVHRQAVRQVCTSVAGGQSAWASGLSPADECVKQPAIVNVPHLGVPCLITRGEDLAVFRHIH